SYTDEYQWYHEPDKTGNGSIGIPIKTKWSSFYAASGEATGSTTHNERIRRICSLSGRPVKPGPKPNTIPEHGKLGHLPDKKLPAGIKLSDLSCCRFRPL